MPSDYSIIGKPSYKVDGIAKASGATKYTDDISLPGMLFGRTLRSPFPHARILKVDCTRALSRPGVCGAITGADLPVAYGVLANSQDEHALAVEKVTYVGEPVAALAAQTEELAEAALSDIEVEYDPLPAVFSIGDALKEAQVRIQETGPEGNIHTRVPFEFGDLDAGFDQADVVREDFFFYGGSNHLAMEQHSALAQIDSQGRLTVWASTQTLHYLRKALAKVLSLPLCQIRVIVPTVGGAFGGKSEPFSHELCAAKLSLMTGSPVKFTLTREEVFYAHRGRHPTLMSIKTGVERDGSITAMHFKSFLDGGANSSYGLVSTLYSGSLQTTTYRLPAYKFEGVRVFTNKPVCGPKRGHGMVQARFALEVQLDKIACELNLDPVEMRLNQLVEPNSITVNRLQITSCGLRECIEKVVDRSDFRNKRGQLRMALT